MAFTTDFETETLLPEGEYECIVHSAYMTATRGGPEYFSVRLIIRNDVPQKYQNKNIFYQIWKKKEPTDDDRKVDGLNFKQLMSLSKACKIPNGKSYETIDDLGKDMKNQPVLVTIEHNEWNGSINERVRYTNETKYPECRHIFKGRAAETHSGTDVGESEETIIDFDEDLPF